MQDFDFQTLDSQLKLDVSIFQSHLNNNIAKINRALKYLLSKVNHQQQSHTRYQETYQEQYTQINNHTDQIQNVKNNQQSIFNQIYIEQGGGKRVSRINNIENEIIRIKEVMRQQTSGGTLARLQSRGKSGHYQNNGLRSSQIRIKDLNIREGEQEKRGNSRMKASRMDSRKKIKENVNDKSKDDDEQYPKSMTTSFVKRIGSKPFINYDNKNAETFSDDDILNVVPSRNESRNDPFTFSSKKSDQDLYAIFTNKFKQLQLSYQNRLQTIQKKLKIKNKQGIKFQQKETKNNEISARKITSGNDINQLNTTNYPNVPYVDSSQLQNQAVNQNNNSSKEEQESQQWIDPSQKQYQEMKALISQANSQLKKQQLEQKQLSKRSNDILIKFQKNHQRVTAALKYLEKNINKIFQKLKQANIIDQKEIVQLNDDMSKDKIGKITRVSDRLSLNDKISNRIQVMDHLVKNIQEQVKQMKYAIGLYDASSSSRQGFLPKIDDRENINRIKQGTINRDILQHVNSKLTDLQTAMDKMKVKMKSMSDNADQFPLKLLQLSSKMRQQSEIRQQRLIELIKQIVNRILLDPFNNNFTNHLKKQIYVKFLQIKHEYGAIWKQIEKKVEDRADKKQIDYLNQRYQTNMLEIRNVVAKKTDAQDNKKWMKFVQSKLKELFEAIKLSQNNQYKLVQEHTLSIKKKDKEK